MLAPHTPHTPNHSHNLLSYHRVNNPSQDQAGHRDEQGPEDFLDLLVLSERISWEIQICLKHHYS
jgi:hypothetical protein